MKGLKVNKIYQPPSLTFVIFHVLVSGLAARNHLLCGIPHFYLASILNISALKHILLIKILMPPIAPSRGQIVVN